MGACIILYLFSLSHHCSLLMTQMTSDNKWLKWQGEVGLAMNLATTGEGLVTTQVTALKQPWWPKSRLWMNLWGSVWWTHNNPEECDGSIWHEILQSNWWLGLLKLRLTCFAGLSMVTSNQICKVSCGSATKANLWICKFNYVWSFDWSSHVKTQIFATLTLHICLACVRPRAVHKYD